MEGTVSIRTEESEESDAEPKGRHCRQVKQREGVRYGLLCCSQGQKDQDPVCVCAAADLLHSMAWSRLFSPFSDVLSLDFPSRAMS